MIYKGRSLSGQAKASEQAADWASIRGWFMRANKIDVEAPEPLYRYYETFLLEGTKPPKDAVDALLYSAVLVPQDRSVRWAAVQQLLIDNKMQQAREWFAPLAYDPHASTKSRETADKIMDAMAKGDRESVLDLLQKHSGEEEGEAKGS